MDNKPGLAPQLEATESSFGIPRKSISISHKPAKRIPELKSQQHNNSGLSSVTNFHRWLADLPDRSWLPEVVSLLLACVAFTAIVVTLAIHQGRPLPQWPGLISINALIAIFTAIFKAALVMPVAEGE